MKLANLSIVAVSYLSLVSAMPVLGSDDASPADLEKRKCFHTGESFGSSREAALDAAEYACTSDLIGTYSKRETRVRCYGIGNGKSVKLTVGLTGKNAPATRRIQFNECVDGLHKEIQNCGRGGDTTYGNWRYRADPNKGGC
ncbi:hypothetical protein CC79DRAFT_1349646 [Sarocladium strictum]